MLSSDGACYITFYNGCLCCVPLGIALYASSFHTLYQTMPLSIQGPSFQHSVACDIWWPNIGGKLNLDSPCVFLVSAVCLMPNIVVKFDICKESGIWGIGQGKLICMSLLLSVTVMQSFYYDCFSSVASIFSLPFLIRTGAKRCSLGRE